MVAAVEEFSIHPFARFDRVLLSHNVREVAIAFTRSYLFIYFFETGFYLYSSDRPGTHPRPGDLELRHLPPSVS